MEPGIYPNMTRDEYDEELCLNQSTIKVAHEKSMMHAYNKLINPSAPTAAMIIGKAFHAYLLEPDDFWDRFAIMPVTDNGAKVSRASKKGASIWDEWEEEHGHKYAIKQRDVNMLVAMRESVMRNKEARHMMERIECMEASFFWQHPEFDFDCKAQLDMLTTLNGWTTVADLKSCADASQAGFEKMIANDSLMVQDVWYREGLNAIAEGEREFRFIAVEKDFPYPCAVYQLDPLNVFEGKHRCDVISMKWDRALDEQDWPGYPGGTNIARAKKFAMSHERAEYEDNGEEEAPLAQGSGGDTDA